MVSILIQLLRLPPSLRNRTRTDGPAYAAMRRAMHTSFGRDVGIGSTLTASLDDVLGVDGSSTPAPTPTDNTGGTAPNDTQNLPVAALRVQDLGVVRRDAGEERRPAERKQRPAHVQSRVTGRSVR